jgi:hypothetical protein
VMSFKGPALQSVEGKHSDLETPFIIPCNKLGTDHIYQSESESELCISLPISPVVLRYD